MEGFIKSHREEIIRLETESSEIGRVRKRLAEGTAAAKISLVGKVG